MQGKDPAQIAWQGTRTSGVYAGQMTGVGS